MNVQAGEPSVAAFNTGEGYVAVWSVVTPGQDGGNIRGRIVNATASATDFQINVTTTGAQFRPSVATLADGNFVVAWAGASDGLLVIDLAASGAAGANGSITQAKDVAFGRRRPLHRRKRPVTFRGWFEYVSRDSKLEMQRRTGTNIP